MKWEKCGRETLKEEVGAVEWQTARVDISNSGLILYETMNCDIDAAS